jgi:peptidoglycan-associated lipoprotein
MIRPRITLTTIAVAALVLSLGAAGCAKKATQVPPTPPPAPPTQPTTPVTPPTTPVTPPTTPKPTDAEIIANQLKPVFFALDSDRLDDAGRAALDANAKVMRDNPGLRVMIEGHCDERGTVEYNQALGERRATSARDYLVRAGVEASRISTVSYGKERPFAEGATEEAWSQNRRAHFAQP